MIKKIHHQTQIVINFMNRLLIKNNDLGNTQKYLSLVFVGSESALDKRFSEINNIIKKLIEDVE